ncbi:uncharacterized protein LOC124158859 isoform X3 [Ischnura elegans]|uniref:uncharacterized protein LOC124158859 isoform X3 n=1 Tax=Ischnura elegans TaxID=197161 RepID=UPI001ED8B51D|nr:uncharacterized protein LOC124158859 isoform X3 [Ischnura elegans]
MVCSARKLLSFQRSEKLLSLSEALFAMSEVKTGFNTEFVSEVNVEGDVSDVDVVSTLRNLGLGTHQSVCHAESEKADDCFILGKVVNANKLCPLNGVWKLIIQEVTPQGCPGDVFALFALGKVAKHLSKHTVKDGSMLIIHQPQVHKSCLMDFKSLQSHGYDLQVISGYATGSKCPPQTGVFIQLIRLKVPDAVETITEVIGSVPDEVEEGLDVVEVVPNKSEKVPNVADKNPEQLPKNPAEEGNSSLEKSVPADVEVEELEFPPKRFRRIKKLLPSEEYKCLRISPRKSGKLQRHVYTPLGEITPKCRKANIIGVITSVEVLFEDGVPNGWVRSGELLATVDSDDRKPVSLLSLQENCSLSAEDEERIHELRDYVKTLITPAEIQNGGSESSSISGDCGEYVPTGGQHVGNQIEDSRVQHISTDEMVIGVSSEINAQEVSVDDKHVSSRNESVSGKDFSADGELISSRKESGRGQEISADNKGVSSRNGSVCGGDVSTGLTICVRNKGFAQGVSGSDEPVSSENVSSSAKDKCDDNVPVSSRDAIVGVEEECDQHVDVMSDKAEEELKKQRAVLEQVLAFLKDLPGELNSLYQGFLEKRSVDKCLKCGTMSLSTTGVSTRRSSNMRLSPRLPRKRESTVSVEKLSGKAKCLRRTVQSVLSASAPVPEPS